MILRVLILSAIVLGGCMDVSPAAEEERPSGKVLVSLYTDHPIHLDAAPDKEVWDRAQAVVFRDDTFRNFPLKSDNLVEVRTLWDEVYLYIRYRVYDRDIRSVQVEHEHPRISSDDIVEFLINRNNDRIPCWNENNIIYHINLHGMRLTDRGGADCRPDRSWNGSAESAIHLFGTLNDSTDIDEGYLVEVAFPWAELDITPEPNTRLGINFAVGDSRIFFDWAGGKPFRTPESFGELLLIKEE